jgi:protein-tyrosine phosphatase
MTRRRRAFWLLATALIVGGGYASWKQWGRHRFFAKNWGTVEDGRIYRSGLVHRALIEDELREHRITTVVDLSAEGVDHPDVAAERAAAEKLGIRALEVNGLDGYGVGDVAAYVVALEEMSRAQPGEAVLVHCAGGSERTGAACAMYRMLFQGWDGKRAYEEYLGYRGDPPKNDILPRFVNQILPEVADRLAKSGTLPSKVARVPRFGPAGGWDSVGPSIVALPTPPPSPEDGASGG